MDQLHKRFTVEQVKVVLQGYCQGTMSRAEVEEMLSIGKTRFFALLKAYQSPATFSTAYERDAPGRLSASVEAAIEKELLREKELVDDPQLPISDYNYTALRDRLKKTASPCQRPPSPIGPRSWSATNRTGKVKRMTAKW